MAALPQYANHSATNAAIGTAAQYFGKTSQPVDLNTAFVMLKTQTGETNAAGQQTYVSTAIRLSDLVAYVVATANGQ